MGRPRILVVGSMNMDLIMYGVERIPKMGESVFSKNYSYGAGGKGSNQAFAAAMQGAESYFVGRIGNDDNGKVLIEQLNNAGVDTQYVVVDEESHTGLAIMNVNPEGNYFSVLAIGANNCIQPQDVQKALDKNEFDMVVMQLEMPLETVYKTYEFARKKGIPVFLDAGPTMSIPLERLNGIFVISPNEAETEALTGIFPDTAKHIEEAAKWLYKEVNPQYVILKLGCRGALLFDGKEMKMIEGFKVNAIDTTAAGDTFGAAFSVQYCKGADVETAIRFAHAAAAICVTRKGGHPSIPTEEETRIFYQEHRI